MQRSTSSRIKSKLPTKKGKSLVKGKAPDTGTTDSPRSSQMPDKNMADSNMEPTRPPRVSFGVELEFLVASNPLGARDPDPQLKGRLGKTVEEDPNKPQDVNRDCHSVTGDAIVALLRKHGIPTEAAEAPIEEPLIPKPAKWHVKYDYSVREIAVGGYSWAPMELISPASYAYDEAFEMVELVVRLVATNFRTRVNSSCGLHIHVGNGPHRPDLRTFRNYACLIWGADPLLSKFQSPARVAGLYAPGLRMTDRSFMGGGETAEMARDFLANGKPKWAHYYLGRARKLGEAPVASIKTFRERIEQIPEDKHVDPDWNSDDSDWEAGEPFFRPKRVDLEGKESNDPPNPLQIYITDEAEIRKLDAATLAKGPPQTETIVAKDSGMQSARKNNLPTTLERPSGAFMTRQCQRKAQDSVEKIIEDYPKQCVANTKPSLTNGWQGGRELLSCDVSISQIARLLQLQNDGVLGRYLSYNWSWLDVKNVNPGSWSGSNVLQTVECRMAAGSLDAKWIVTWAKIQCRLLEWARDAEPSKFMRVIGLLYDQDGREEPTYDILDLLEDIGMHEEIKICEDRLKRAAEGWNECMLVKSQKPFAPCVSGPASPDII